MKKYDDLISLARERMDEAIDAERDNREEALDDLQNLAGQQWPDNIKAEREGNNRPVLTINRLPQFLRQVTGDLRNMNPSINILPGDHAANKDTAEIIEGLIRQIQYRSDASSVYERAGESAAACGAGYFRIRTDYIHEDSFDQEILIETIHNPFSVYFDPAAKMPTREDAEFCFVSQQMREKEFKSLYPNAQMVSVDTDGQTDSMENWRNGNEIVVAEYFYKEYDEVTIGLMEDGTVIENPVAPLVMKRTRKTKRPRIMWAKISGKEVLEGPKPVAGKHIPVVAVFGEEMHVGENVVRNSVIRFAKDPQRLYNYWRSAQTELVALQPKAPYIVSVKQIAGLEAIWQTANDTNAAYLPYIPDEKAPPPQRAQPPVASQGMMQEVMTAAEDMKATTGIYDAGLGNSSSEKSGVAIRQRQMESDISTSVYSDNVAKAISHAGRIILSMIPTIYDTQRLLRIVGKDDVEKMVPVNGIEITQDGSQPVNDLTSGKYDVRVTVGPNYTTRRQETAQSMTEVARGYPALWQLAGDLIVGNMDWPGADQIADRLKKALPPGMRDQEDLSPEEQQAAQQAAQQQQMQAAIQQALVQANVKKEMAEAEEATADAEKARFEVMDQQLETMAKTGQLNAAIAGIVQQEIARALQGAAMGRQPI